MTKTTYNDDSIQSLDGISHIRLRYQAYLVGDGGKSTILHLIKEIIDNANDETILKGADGITQIVFFRDTENNSFQIMITDNGRGIPINKLLDSFCKTQTSGKFNNDSYQFSSGSLGVGSSVASGLSRHFKAITHRERSAMFSIYNGIIPTKINETKKPLCSSGTQVILEPDPKYLSGIADFMNDGPDMIMDLLQIFNLFVEHRLVFRVSNVPIDDEIWTSDIRKSQDILDKAVSDANTIFDNAVHSTSHDDYVRSKYNVTRPWTWTQQHELPLTKDAEMAYKIRLYLTKHQSQFECLSMVNMLPMTDLSSTHIVQTTSCIKRMLAEYITDTDIKKFVIDKYKLPMYICMDVKYLDATYVGLHKNGFKNAQFAKMFSKSLMSIMRSNDNKKSYKALYDALSKDITDKYSVYTSGQVTVKNDQRLILELNYPTKFFNCSTEDRSQAELFIAEGNSAGSKENRNSETQAMYSLRGKPFNAVNSIGTIDESRKALQKNDIFQDILKIIGLTTTTTDFNTLKYGKVFIMTDADDHGKHIANILIGNFYLINPGFVESGKLHLVTPPLYGLTLKNCKSQKDPIFIRTADDMITAMAASIYYEALEVYISSDGTFDTPKLLDKEELVDFAKITHHIGSMFTRLSQEHIVDPIILEQLTHVSYYLTPETMNIEYLKSVLGYDTMKYDKVNNILFMSLGHKDITLPLYSISDSFYREILPFLNKIQWQRLKILIKTKRTNVFNNDMVSFVQLYHIFRSLDNMCSVSYYKGLGSLPSELKSKTCLDPTNRRSICIRSIGDVHTYFQMLGKDPSHRKKLISFQEPVE